MSMELLNAMNGAPCPCGKDHRFTADVVIGKGVLTQIPAYIRKLGGTKAFVLSDVNTYRAAGERVCEIMQQADIAFVSYSFPQEDLEPDEHSVGGAVMHYDTSCNVIVGVGSGVINDIGKILSNLTGKPYIVVGTAPSMDGYASASSSMTRDGLKISLPSRSADVIVGLQVVDGHVDRAAHERGQRQIADGRAVFKVVIRALTMGAEVAGQIQRGVEIRDRSAGIVADQAAAAALRLRIEHLGQVDDAQVAHLVYTVSHGNLLLGLCRFSIRSTGYSPPMPSFITAD